MRLALGATTMTIAAGGCLSFGDLSGGGDPGPQDDGSIRSNDGSSIDSAIPNDGSTPSDGSVVLGDGACGGIHGATLLRVGSGASSFCIDPTEVTLRDYRLFLAAADAGATIVQPPECSWNTSFGGANTLDQFYPVTGVDWCDAYAYCAWAGKHLCGEIGGGPVPYDNSIGDPTKSQWMAVCSHAPDGGVQQYPYGNTPSATACNGSERDAGGIVEVGSLTGCVGGYPGVFDMSGNVDEWTDSCDHATGKTDCCVSAGGGFHDFETQCGVGDVAGPSCPGRTRADVHSDVGFRCCGN
jgi:formylglycine-generating enzyme